MSDSAPAGSSGFEIKHDTLGSIELEQMPSPGQPAQGRVRRTDQRVLAVLTRVAPSREVLDRLAQFDHPDVVPWLGTCEVDNSTVALSELAEGGSLLERISQRRLDDAEVARVILSVAAALGALADKGLSHGDVSPANVVLTAGGRPLLADLHDCVLADGAALNRATPGFEGISGNATHRNDLSALGRLVENLTVGSTTWPTKGLREAVELLVVGDTLTDAVSADLRDQAAPRIKVIEPGDDANRIEMITRRFGPRPDRATTPSTQPSSRRVLIAAALLSATVTAAVLWGEQPPGCDDTNCADEQER